MTNGHTPEKKKGLPVLAWVGIGCLGVIILGIVVALLGSLFIFNKAKDFAAEVENNPALMAAKAMAMVNPELELVETDEEGRVVTFRNTESGEEFTINYSDLEEGRLSYSSDDGFVEIVSEEMDGQGNLSITTDEGRTTFGAGADADFPGWVPIYPGSSPEGTYASDTPEMRGGAYTIRTNDKLEEVMDFFSSELEKAGLEITNRTNLLENAILIARTSDEARTCSITAVFDDGEVRVTVNFAEK